ncbi:TonB-dependent receptor [Sphingomonas sp. LaA6.9]|uniref:TonB-dependent receptor n=1 Tax=Sphingomonas sp. LaA6.9 TaxID=2919914 RepID=UPI001F4FCDDA|nr:TonB-dependent receptor [Sphingomonas sp. LaA6.9]MCJ8157572.1 TonB-dependent receptor [Sphingomonas sp. LaA6.9]
MTKLELLTASALALVIANPALAQDTASETGIADIVVTAQRQAERLQDVPIAVSAFSAEALESQQIENATDLQLTLPNVTFTKTNFTSSSFTIRGIGDLCVGITCDQATAIHVNDMPLLSTRLFETEYFDLERVEVLRGPQGTLFGRNATSGVVNFITAKPDLTEFQASGSFEYGNFESYKINGMVNAPITDTLGVRLAGYYLNRDGYTKNVYDNTRIDGRDLYALRGSLRWEPSSSTTLDLIGYYFREKDDRSRIQNQLCNRDPTGILGCAPDKLENETTNGNSTLAALIASNEFLGIASAASGGALARFGLGSIYGPDVYANFAKPDGLRNVNIDFAPTYFAEEYHIMGRLQQQLGDQFSLTMTGGYTHNTVDSRTDYNLAVEAPLANNPGLAQLNALGRAGSPFAFLNAVRQALIPNGPAGGVCQSDADPNGVGVYGGNTIGCFGQSLDFDRSKLTTRQYAIEGHVDSQFDGMFNFLIGANYLDSQTKDNSYYVNAFGLDYATGILGAANTGGAAFFGTPFYRNDSDLFRLKSFGIFGEAYVEFNDRLKLTLGLRYNDDKKFIRARTTLLQDSAGQFPAVPFGSDSFTDALNYALLDFDATKPGAQEYAEHNVSFNEFTGRAVLDYKITDDNLVYLSYSRGYKSGGVNPPLSPIFAVPVTFDPETVDSFEIGSKNTFLDGTLRLNLTGFYYKYKDLQLSRIVARTSVNDNVSADIYGVEAEAIISPVRALIANLGFSYLHSKVSNDKFLSNPRDPSGGRSDAVIIKDLQNASNCAVVPTTAGNVVGVNTYVTAVNTGLGLRGPVAVPGTNTTGAFSICSALAATAANPPAALRALFGVPTGALPFQVLGSGVEVNLKGNELPQAPNFKFSAGLQYTVDFDNGMSLVPRIDLTYTGESYASIFNGNIDRMPGYEVINAQIQLNGQEDRWFVRAFVQNLTKNNAITGQYVTDQSSGLFTNVFTLEPRRYGLAAGFKF